MWDKNQVHHDIKPENIMIRRNPTAKFPDYYEFYLIDFGFTRFINQTSIGVGTLLYAVKFN